MRLNECVTSTLLFKKSFINFLPIGTLCCQFNRNKIVLWHQILHFVFINFLNKYVSIHKVTSLCLDVYFDRRESLPPGPIHLPGEAGVEVLAGRGLGLQVGEGVVLVGVAVGPRQQHPRLAQAARTLPLEQRDFK